MICDNCTTSFNPDVEGTIYHGNVVGTKAKRIEIVIALCTSCSENFEAKV